MINPRTSIKNLQQIATATKKNLEKLNGHYGGHKKIALIKHHYYTFTLQLGPALKNSHFVFFALHLYFTDLFITAILTRMSLNQTTIQY